MAGLPGTLLRRSSTANARRAIGDRRVVRVALTPEGETLAAELTDAARRHEAAVLARFPELGAAEIKAELRSVLERELGRDAA